MEFSQTLSIHNSFPDYSLNPTFNDKAHEAGYDALMTGILWFKLQSQMHHPVTPKFPGIEKI